MNSMLMIFLCNRCRCLLRLVLFRFRLFDRSLSVDRLGYAIVKVKATFYAREEVTLVIHQNALYFLGIEYLTMKVLILYSRTGFLNIGSELYTQFGKLLYQLLAIAIIGNITELTVLVETLRVV